MGEQTLGSEIARLRAAAGITLRQFAKKVGISASHQSDIEHDRRRPSREVLRRIATQLRHVGGTYEHLDRLNTGIDPELQRWASETPGVRAMLRSVHDSGEDPREVLRRLEEAAKEDKR